MKRVYLAPAIIVCLFLGLAAAQQQAPQNRKSPHETITTTINGKTISITYGRPYLRGRKAVGGNLVPYGKVWRTGADEATVLNTNADLQIGDLKVPAGQYALFTLPGPDQWQLIISKNAKQWGAFSYKESEDLGRVPMQVTHLDQPVEQFTISLKETGSGEGTLTMAWENTQASVPFKVLQ